MLGSRPRKALKDSAALRKAADGEDFLPEAFACGGDVVAFFKGGVGIGAEDFYHA